MSDTEQTKPHLYGAPEPAHGADPTTPPTGFRGEEKATAGEGHKREVTGGDGRAITVEETSGIAAAEARGPDPHSDDR